MAHGGTPTRPSPRSLGDMTRRSVPFLGPDDLPFELDADGVSASQDGLQVAWLRDPDGSVLTVFSD